MTQYQDKINIIMIGHTGAGKSQLGNSILQQEVFKVGHGGESKTQKTQYGIGKLNDLDLRIIDTRGFSDTKEDEQKHKDDWKKMADLFVDDKSIDGIIFVFNFASPRKGPEYKNLIQKMKEIFGIEILKQRLKIVFTNAKFSFEYDPNKEEIQTNDMIRLFGDDIIGRDDIIFVNTDSNLIRRKELKYFDRIIEIIEKFNKIKKQFGSMDNQKVEMKKKELEEKEKKERERKGELEDKKKIKIAQFTTISTDIIKYEEMISQKKKEIEDYKRRIEGAKKGLIASAVFTVFTAGFSGFGIAHCMDEKKSFEASISRLEGEIYDCERKLEMLRKEQAQILEFLKI